MPNLLCELLIELITTMQTHLNKIHMMIWFTLSALKHQEQMFYETDICILRNFEGIGILRHRFTFKFVSLMLLSQLLYTNLCCLYQLHFLFQQNT